MAEWNASEYSRQSSLQQAMALDQLSRLTLQGDERILDVGCGDGKITAQIAGRVPHGSVLGIDPSRNMIAFASTHFSPAVQANLRFEVADAQHLTFQAEFDLVVSFNALHWVRDHVAALRSVRNALKPGGRTLLRFVPEGSRPSLEDVIEDVRQLPRWTGHFANFQRPFFHFTPEEYRALAKSNGFQVDQVESRERTWDFGTREAFIAFCQVTFVEWTRFVPETEQQNFIVDVLDHYQSLTAVNPQEANTFKFEQMEVVLQRPLA
jgi:trans-aconitate methyltransferase